MRTNVALKQARPVTHEGGIARRLTKEQQLRRTVLTAMLGEDTFYEDGVSIKERIKQLASEIDPLVAHEIARDARTKYKLRHAPLAVAVGLCRNKTIKGPDRSVISRAVLDVIQRPDEMGELIAQIWEKDGKIVRSPLPAQVKKALAQAFVEKFDAYQLKKYANRSGAVSLRDVMFLTHPKPRTAEQTVLFSDLASNSLSGADTWEKRLSAGENKAQSFETLLLENRLGYDALLKNLRLMTNEGVSSDLINKAIRARRGAQKVLPMRFVVALRHAPQYLRALNDAFLAGLSEGRPLEGKTTALIDVSGSMHWAMSGKTELNRIDAASALAACIPAEDTQVFTFADHLMQIPGYSGLALIDAIKNSQNGGTQLGRALRLLMNQPQLYGSRLIVISDEQTSDALPHESEIAKYFPNMYMINVAPYRNGVGYGNHWVHVDGFSEATLEYIREYESFMDATYRMSSL